MRNEDFRRRCAVCSFTASERWVLRATCVCASATRNPIKTTSAYVCTPPPRMEYGVGEKKKAFSPRLACTESTRIAHAAARPSQIKPERSHSLVEGAVATIRVGGTNSSPPDLVPGSSRRSTTGTEGCCSILYATQAQKLCSLAGSAHVEQPRSALPIPHAQWGACMRGSRAISLLLSSGPLPIPPGSKR